MKTVIVAMALAISLACGVDRRSGAFACTATSQCLDGRTCIQGYCVFGTGLDGAGSGGCPTACTSCDVGAMKCTIDNGNTVTCPAGWNCTIDCAKSNSCAMVVCSDAASCTITCSGANTCSTIQCGAGSCKVNCTATTSCTSIQCKSSCQCDTTCAGTNSCLTVQCPHDSQGNACTTTGNNGAPCASSEAASCASC